MASQSQLLRVASQSATSLYGANLEVNLFSERQRSKHRGGIVQDANNNLQRSHGISSGILDLILILAATATIIS